MGELMPGAYLGLLLFSLAGLGLLDWHRRLALWARGGPGRAIASVAALVLVCLVWDLAGIAGGVFFRGTGEHLLGLQIAPEVPIEEVVFLTLLGYVILLTWRLIADRGGRPRTSVLPWAVRHEEEAA